MFLVRQNVSSLDAVFVVLRVFFFSFVRLFSGVLLKRVLSGPTFYSVLCWRFLPLYVRAFCPVLFNNIFIFLAVFFSP